MKRFIQWLKGLFVRRPLTEAELDKLHAEIRAVVERDRAQQKAGLIPELWETKAACTYSGFPDEPEGGPCCAAPAVGGIRCPKCGIVVERCAKHGGLKGCNDAMERHVQNCKPDKTESEALKETLTGVPVTADGTDLPSDPEVPPAK